MRRAFQTGLTAVLVAAALGLPTGAADADTALTVPSTGTLSLSGHGFGHGHGMSQYGAQGAARQGKSWSAIVGFYYPGTAQAKLSRNVRVLISGDTSDELDVSAQTGLIVINTSNNTTATIPANGADRWRLGVSGARTTVWFRKDGTWTYWRSFPGDGAFRAGGSAMTLWYGSGAHHYRGTLVAASPSTGSVRRDTVNELPLDTYIRGVVAREMPSSWSPAALAAQAVAARTYAAYELQHPRAQHYQLCDTTSCQVYGGADAETATTDQAIAATAGVILTYNGAPAFTQFGSSSGGYTSAGSVPYLVSKSDPYDGWTGNTVHNWSRDIDIRTVENAFPGVGDLKSIQVTARYGPSAADWGGRVSKIRLIGWKNGAKTTVDTYGDTFRSRLGLRSTYFTFSKATPTPSPSPSPTA
jgi:stage II sporulation protein D